LATVNNPVNFTPERGFPEMNIHFTPCAKRVNQLPLDALVHTKTEGSNAIGEI